MATISNEEEMVEFCEEANKLGKPFNVHVQWKVDPSEFQTLNQLMIDEGLIREGSHLQQGISQYFFRAYSPLVQDISGFDYEDHIDVILQETPYLYPSTKLLKQNRKLTGPMTGNLSNCYDPVNKLFLFHMRGSDVSAPFDFQAAAAGMGVYGQNPGLTAALELKEEADLENFSQFAGGKAINVLPFMKVGEKGVPQPLFSFGFTSDLSHFPKLDSLDAIAEFKATTKQRLASGEIDQREAYHFTIPLAEAETLVGELNDQNKFCGPIAESHTIFHSALHDSGKIK
jgi:hypothetical protein